ncbi:MAG: hypothetical protein Q7U66_15275 [Methylobacter sp.]|nr:hypothetical protein [Methylobacter sp.]
MLNQQEETLPALGSSDSSDKQERIYRTALAPRDYINLEIEAMNRGLKPFGLTKLVMTLYLRKQLVLVKELPEELRVQIVAHYQAKQAVRQ